MKMGNVFYYIVVGFFVVFFAIGIVIALITS